MKKLLTILLLLCAVKAYSGDVRGGLNLVYGTSDTTALSLSRTSMYFTRTYGPMILSGTGSLFGYGWYGDPGSTGMWYSSTPSILFIVNTDTVMKLTTSGMNISAIDSLNITGTLSAGGNTDITGNLTISAGKITGDTVRTFLNFSIERPDTLLNNTFKIWTNGTGATVHIDSIYAKSPLQNHDFELRQRDKNNGGAGVLTDSLYLSSAGTSTYYDLQTTITLDTLPHDWEWYLDETDSTNSKIEGSIDYWYIKTR